MTNLGVTGAFGFLGANLLRALLEEGDSLGFPCDDTRIVAFASRASSNPLLESPDVAEAFSKRVRVEKIDLNGCLGHLRDRAHIVERFKGLDAVVHLAGIIDYRSLMRKNVWDIDVLGTKAVFDAAAEAGVRKVVCASSVVALGSGQIKTGRQKRFCDEASAPYGDPSWPIAFNSWTETLSAVEASLRGDYSFLKRSRVTYIDAKLAVWELAKHYYRGQSSPIVTIFPGTVVGAGEMHRSISRLVDSVWEGGLRFSLGGQSSFVAARDFARGAALSLAKGRPGEGYILGGRDEHSMSYAAFQDKIAALGRAEGWPTCRKAMVLPPAILGPIAGTVEHIAPGIGLSSGFILSGSLSNPCSSAKAITELGYDPGTDLEPAILECRRFSEKCHTPDCP